MWESLSVVLTFLVLFLIFKNKKNKKDLYYYIGKPNLKDVKKCGNDTVFKEPKMRLNFEYSIDCCPYCKNKLIKIPKRKTKCKKCGQYIFVRSVYGYSKIQKILIKEDIRNEYLKRVNEYSFKNEAKRALVMSFKSELEDGYCLKDVLNRYLEFYYHKEIWGSYRNIHSFVSRYCLLNDDVKSALKHSFILIYLDYINIDMLKNKYIVYSANIKDVENKIPLEYWVSYAKKLISILSYDSDNIRECFIESNSEFFNKIKQFSYGENIQTPIKAWEKIESFFT